MKKLNFTKVILLFICFTNSGIFAQYAPKNGKKLLFMGQDLTSVNDYQEKCIGCPKGHGETTYLSFYLIKEPYIHTPNGGVFYGAMGMDNEGNPAKDDTNWGAGPLNLWKAASRSSLVSIGLNISTRFAPKGLEKIAEGDHDPIIKKMAQLFNKFPETVFYLRIGYEFDGNWYPGYDNTKNYINAYRRIVDVLRLNLRQNNVTYVWQSSGAPVDDVMEEGKREDIMNWYPGDEYVDWTAISWFLPTDENMPLTSNKLTKIPTQRQLSREMLYHSERLNKPMMIAEASPQGYSFSNLTNCNVGSVWDGDAGQNCVPKTADEIYNEWFEPIFRFMAENKEIQAFSYINANWNTQGLWGPPYDSGFWGDSRIETNDRIRDRWIASINEHDFLKMDDEEYTKAAIGYNTAIHNSKNTAKTTTLISLHTNPVDDYLVIDGASNSDPYQVIDMQGTIVLQGIGNTIDVNELSMGMFIVEINGKKTKFIKQ